MAWRRAWRGALILALLAAAAPAWVYVREQCWTPPAIDEPIPSPNGYHALVAASALASESPYEAALMARIGEQHRVPEPVEPWDDPLLPQLRDTVARNSAARAKAETALAQPCWAPATRGRVRRVDGNAKCRALGRALALQARLQQADRDWAGSAQTCLLALEAGLALSHARDYGTALSAASLVQSATKPLAGASAQLEAGKAREAALRVESVADAWPSYAQQLAWWTPADAAAYADPSEALAAAQLWAGLKFSHCYEVLVMPGPRERYRQTTLWLTLGSREGERPYDQQRNLDAAVAPWASQHVYNYHRNARAQLARPMAQMRLLSANLALQAWHVEHRCYPGELVDLVPRYLKRLPPDPFTSTPLRYRREGDGFLCWSIGPDGKDDGGRRITDRNGGNSLATGVYLDRDSLGDLVIP